MPRLPSLPLAAALAGALLAACADPAPYREPAVGPTARVTVIGEGIRFETIDADSCPGIARQELSLPMGMREGITRTVPAQRRWIVGAQGRLDGATCSASAAFVPQASHRYEIRLIATPGAGCHVAADELADDGHARQPVRLQVVDSAPGFCARPCSVAGTDATRATCLSDPHGAIEARPAKPD